MRVIMVVSFVGQIKQSAAHVQILKAETMK